jgi:hypothetical protein
MIEGKQKGGFRITSEIDKVNVFVSNHLIVRAEHHSDPLPLQQGLKGQECLRLSRRISS